MMFWLAQKLALFWNCTACKFKTKPIFELLYWISYKFNISKLRNIDWSFYTHILRKLYNNNIHNNNNIFAIVQSTVSDLLKDSNPLGLEWKSPGSSSSLKYCRRRGSNRCPLAWELGTLPLDQLDLLWFKNGYSGNYTIK